MEMSNAQRMQFIKHVGLLIFSVPLSDPQTLAGAMKNTFTGAEWGQWVVSGWAYGRTFKDSSTGLATLRGFDISLDIGMKNPDGTIKLLNLRFIEQNPNKLDAQGNLKENAILARAGNKIMWVVQNGIENGFLGKLQNGEWVPSRPRAYVAATGPIGIDQYGENAHLNNGKWSSAPTISPQGIDNSITAIMESESLDGECEWTGI